VIFNGKMKRVGTALLVGTVIILSGCLAGNQEKMATWTVKEVWDDYMRENGTSYFVSLEPGDIVTIKDIISKISSKYDPHYMDNITYIGFKSGGAPFLFEGDLTGDYQVGDEVVITLQVIEIEVDGRTDEFFKEMWDGRDVKPVPASAITHAE